MTIQINKGDVVTYTSKSRAVIEAEVERVRDTVEQPLKSGTPKSRFLLTLVWVDPLEGTQYASVYHCDVQVVPNVMA